MSSEVSTGKKRGRPLSTKSCRTCRARHIKCDGMKPVCLRCIRSNLQCDGFTAASQEMSHPSDFLNYGDARQLQYFRDRVTSEISGFYDMQFWHHDVPLLAANHHELYHMMVAIGFLHESNSIDTDMSTTHRPAHEKLALEHCNKAIRRLLAHQGESSSDKIAALAFCLLFITVEIFQNRPIAVAKHLESGLAILSEWVRTFGSTATRSEHNLMRAIAGVIHRFAESFELQVGPAVDTSMFISQNQALSGHAMLILPDTFHDPTSASTYLQAVIELVFGQGNEAPHVQDGVSLLKMWKTRFRRLEEALINKTSDLKTRRHLCFLNIHYLVVKILNETSNFVSEMAFDEHVQSFRKITQYCARVLEIERQQALPELSRMVVTFDLGIIMSLYFTAVRCRDHDVRHKAMQLLLNNPRREGIWLSSITGRVAETLINLEESGLENPRVCDDVPLESRVDLLEMVYKPRPVRVDNVEGDLTPQIHLHWKTHSDEVITSIVALPQTQDDRAGTHTYSVMMPRTGTLDNCKMLIGKKSLSVTVTSLLEL